MAHAFTLFQYCVQCHSMGCGNGILYHYNSFGWLLLFPHLFIGNIHAIACKQISFYGS